jgi:hypothetical protein
MTATKQKLKKRLTMKLRVYQASQRGRVLMLSRPQLAQRFALRKAHELIDTEEQQTGDASDGCGEGPGGEAE